METPGHPSDLPPAPDGTPAAPTPPAHADVEAALADAFDAAMRIAAPEDRPGAPAVPPEGPAPIAALPRLDEALLLSSYVVDATWSDPPRFSIRQRNEVVHCYGGQGASRLTVEAALRAATRGTVLALPADAHAIERLELAAVPLALVHFAYACLDDAVKNSYVESRPPQDDPAHLASVDARTSIDMDKAAVTAILMRLPETQQLAHLALVDTVRNARLTTQRFNRLKHLYINGIAPKAMRQLIEAGSLAGEPLTELEWRALGDFNRRVLAWDTALLRIPRLVEYIRASAVGKAFDGERESTAAEAWKGAYVFINGPERLSMAAVVNLVEQRASPPELGQAPAAAIKAAYRAFEESRTHRKRQWDRFEHTAFANPEFDDVKREAVVQFLQRQAWYPAGEQERVMLPSADGCTTNVYTVVQTMGELLKQRRGVPLVVVAARVRHFLRHYGDLAKALFAIVHIDQHNPIVQRNDVALLHFLQSTVPTLVARARAEVVPSGGDTDDYLQSWTLSGADAQKIEHNLQALQLPARQSEHSRFGTQGGRTVRPAVPPGRGGQGTGGHGPWTGQVARQYQPANQMGVGNPRRGAGTRSDSLNWRS
jgi:hypothetical protein